MGPGPRLATPKPTSLVTVTKPLADDDYVLGTGDEEVERLGLQHLVWRPRSTDAWRRAGFTVGQHLIDVGCGPGYATLDLAAIVGPTGRITAVDRSRHFLGVVDARSRHHGFRNVSPLERDLDDAALPELGADGVWCRWVFAFVKRPRDLLVAIRNALKPGGVLVFHEYFNYASLRLIPTVPEFDAFVATVMSSWRASGGEPDIGPDLLRWLPELGFRIVETRPIVDLVSPRNFVWHWPGGFVRSGLQRLVELGSMTNATADKTWETFNAAAANPHVQMCTPGVLEVIAARNDIDD